MKHDEKEVKKLMSLLINREEGQEKRERNIQRNSINSDNSENKQ